MSDDKSSNYMENLCSHDAYQALIPLTKDILYNYLYFKAIQHWQECTYNSIKILNWVSAISINFQ